MFGFRKSAPSPAPVSVTDSSRVDDGITRMTQNLSGPSGLQNHRTGLGTNYDKARGGHWNFEYTDHYTLQAAYRSNAWARAVVDIPAEDMMREGWTFDEDEVECDAITEECERLGVNEEVRKAVNLSRLFGWSAIYMSDGAEDVSEPLSDNGLVFIRALSCYELVVTQINHDISSSDYGNPLYYTIATNGAGAINVHPSRVVVFIGNEVPKQFRTSDYYRLGDSILEPILPLIEHATATQQGIAALVQEAKVDVFQIHNFMDRISTKKQEDALTARFSAVTRLKSMFNSVFLDMKDEYTQKQISFTGLPEIQSQQLEVIAAASDIPATRFLGQSPGGMNATGDSDFRNYYDSIGAKQERDLRPRLDIIFRAILAPFGKDLPKYDFNPLWQMDEKDRAEINNKNAATSAIYANILGAAALAEGIESRIKEDGIFIGFEPTGLLPPELPEPRVANDAEPRTLYVSRKVVNGKDIIDWAIGQGFKNTLEASDLHVTIIYSRTPVDWIKAGTSWSTELEIPEGGPRIVEPLGDKGAVVLHVSSNELNYRHEDIRERTGASHDFSSFQTHITITYDGADLDLTEVEAYQGPIILGPEIFEELDLDWKPDE